MKNLTFNKELNTYNISYDETSDKSPTIIALREKKDSNLFWANAIDYYDFPIFFNTYSLDDIVFDETGEYIKKAFAVVSNKDLNNFFSCEKSNLNNANEVEVIFNPPRKITYLVNFTKDFELYDKLKAFKCPKTGSY